MKTLTITPLVRITVGAFILISAYACNTPTADDASISSPEVEIQLHDLQSEIRNEVVPVSVILPPNHSESDKDLPLLIHLHGGGGDRNSLTRLSGLYTQMFNNETLPSMVIVSFSSGPGSFYHGSWEDFVTKELPTWANHTFGTSLDPDKTLMTGISMGGYGTLKIAFKNPDRFKAIAPMEPAIMPTLEWPEENTRASWWLPKASVEAIWGDSAGTEKFLRDNPANLARSNAQKIKARNLDIYLEVGDQDFIQLQDGAEFLHRVLWDHDIPHEYHLVRWADHVGLSMNDRIIEAHAFLAASLKGGKAEPIDLVLTEAERAYAENVMSGANEEGYSDDQKEGEGDVNQLLSNPERAPSIHATLCRPLKNLAADDPDMKRAYGILPDTQASP